MDTKTKKSSTHMFLYIFFSFLYVEIRLKHEQNFNNKENVKIKKTFIHVFYSEN